MSELRLGMIGCGQISERFFKQAEALPDVKFVATCARHRESAERKGREHGVDLWFDDYERMMEEVALDGVVVATPHSLHAAPCRAAFRRGLHVLNEKPMATSLGDCMEMVRLADENGCVFMNLPFDHSPAFLTALKYLNEATLGKFTGAESVLMIPGPPRDNWYYDRSIAGGHPPPGPSPTGGDPVDASRGRGGGECPRGGAMLDCLVYPMSRLVSLLGPAKRVTALVNNLIPQRIVAEGKRVDSDVDDNATLIVEWAGGQQAVVRTLWGTSFAQNNTAIYGRSATLFLDGANVVIHPRADTLEGWKDGGAEGNNLLPIFHAPNLEYPIEWRGFANCACFPVDESIRAESMIEHFATCIRNRCEPKCSGRLQMHVHEILFRAYAAAETGKAQELETAFEPWHEVEPAFYNTRDGFI